eukprot:3866828-Amphidinium_carterae.1
MVSFVGSSMLFLRNWSAGCVQDFGGVYQSMLSLFMAITSGRSWGDFSTVLAETHPVAEAKLRVYEAKSK